MTTSAADSAYTTYVPGFEYDVFVSYSRRASRENELDEHYTWVTRFQGYIQSILKTRCPGARVFFDDASIAGNDVLDDTIARAVQRAATLVVILSPVYLTRPYCKKELDLFSRSVGNEKAAVARIFLAHYDDVRLEDRPALLKLPKGYLFFYRDPVTENLRRPLDDGSEQLKELYKNQMYLMCGEIEIRLNELRRSAGKPPPSVVPPPPDDVAPVIYLAEAGPDLRSKKDRRTVQVALLQAGFRVTPETTYDRDLTAYRKALDEDLSQSMLFIQILGEAGSERSPALPRGYEGLQFERARAAGKPRLRWRPLDLDLESIRDLSPDYYRYLMDEDPLTDGELEADERVQAGFVEDFKATIEETVRKIQARQAKSGGMTSERRTVLLSPQEVDQPLARQFDRQLRDAGANIESQIADDRYSLSEVYEDERGLVVMYGKGEYDWVTRRIKQCREIALNRAANPPICAIFVGPPEDKPAIPKRPSNFYLIRHDDPQGLSEYLAEVAPEGAAL